MTAPIRPEHREAARAAISHDGHYVPGDRLPCLRDRVAQLLADTAAAARLAGARAMKEAAKRACEEVRDVNAAGDDDPRVFAAAGACYLGICALVPEDVVKEANDA